jgi:subfamily B ATP-binding cassette protein MsbA
MDNIEDESVSLRRKIRGVYRVVEYRPFFASGIVVLSVFTAVLEGIGISFILPVIEIARGSDGSGSSTSDLLNIFVEVYRSVGVPFTLETVVIGLALVMFVRFSMSFLVDYLKISLRTDFVRELQTRSFENALDARVAYFDQKGNDQILNAIVTQAKEAGAVIETLADIVEEGLLSLIYLSIALYLSAILTFASAVVLIVFIYVVRVFIESGYTLGDRVASANERVQTAVQAGTQGIRDVKLYNLSDELFESFRLAVGQYASATIRARRNQAAINNAYQFAIALTVFLLIYAIFEFTDLSLAGLGIFLFAMFRLGPRVSTMNNKIYNLESNLPHLVRTLQFIDELKSQRDPASASEAIPDRVDRIAFDDVSFTYQTSDERVLDGVTFDVERGEFVAFVGSSGAGKSTIVSLLSRLYEPDQGVISANGVPIDTFETEAWRSRVAVVRQHPFLFNDTLWYNVTVGKRDTSMEEVERVCEIAQVTEFLDDLPNGYETTLGDDGVRLSGGQRQRVAIARALLKEADILALDEATSDLDSTLEKRVHDAIESMDRDQAVLVIAHRLSTVINADRIYTMEDGQIAECGRHTELLERGGKYAELYATQSQDVR